MEVKEMFVYLFLLKLLQEENFEEEDWEEEWEDWEEEWDEEEEW
jgi:hypothetical protein